MTGYGVAQRMRAEATLMPRRPDLSLLARHAVPTRQDSFSGHYADYVRDAEKSCGLAWISGGC